MVACLAVVVITAVCLVRADAAVPEYTATVVEAYPHDPAAFTEGLFYYNGFLYESTGRSGQSSIREVRLQTGEVVHQRSLDPKYFGEGIVVWKNRLLQLTWKNEIGFIYDLKTFAPLSTFNYSGEGWALTHDKSHIIMSDGTADLRLLDPGTLRETARIHVTCEGRDIHRINELEWVKGEIYANVWLTNVIIRIDPATGKIAGLIDLSDLAASATVLTGDNVLNGIAYDAASDRLFVTGKLWPKLYQITLAQRQAPKDLCQTLP
jgi:glutaminyl-peptide cyclotransferase